MNKTLKSNLETLIALSIACFGVGFYKGIRDAQNTTEILDYLIFYAPACLGGYIGGLHLNKSKITSAVYAGTSLISTAAGLGVGYLSGMFS